MRMCGYLLLAAVCLATARSSPTTYPPPQPDEQPQPDQQLPELPEQQLSEQQLPELPEQQLSEQPAAAAQQGMLPSSGWGLASLDALAQRVNHWLAPVVRVIEHAVKNKTVTEVVGDAQDATVQLATRVSQSDAVQGAKDAMTPLTRLFGRVHDRVKDKTIQQLAGDVQRQIERLDQSVADFISGLGDDREDQAIVEQIVPAAEAPETPEEVPEEVPESPEVDIEQQRAAAVAALDQASEADNELGP